MMQHRGYTLLLTQSTFRNPRSVGSSNVADSRRIPERWASTKTVGCGKKQCETAGGGMRPGEDLGAPGHRAHQTGVDGLTGVDDACGSTGVHGQWAWGQGVARARSDRGMATDASPGSTTPPVSPSPSLTSTYPSKTHIKKKKGSRSFDHGASRIDAVWDLSPVNYGPSGSEPVSDFFIAVVGL
ncbi:hypothetical protein QJS10_CPA01g01802 [Acorus calamus]|uniref:Uncharacterized protein n=1 Tax=Acorus calamus TaxID=4465 RepID=A0AAV9FQY1_ACOCL|nr:hypothetical protein QJS10_CPA01g01802 [Acorus calamus]